MWGLRLCLLNHIETNERVRELLPSVLEFALNSMEGSHMKMVQSALDCICGLAVKRTFLQDNLERITNCIAAAMKRPSFASDGKAWLLLSRCLQALLETFGQEFIQISRGNIIQMLLDLVPTFAETGSPYLLPVCECLGSYLSKDSTFLISLETRDYLCRMALQVIQDELKVIGSYLNNTYIFLV